MLGTLPLSSPRPFFSESTHPREPPHPNLSLGVHYAFAVTPGASLVLTLFSVCSCLLFVFVYVYVWVGASLWVWVGAAAKANQIQQPMPSHGGCI